MLLIGLYEACCLVPFFQIENILGIRRERETERKQNGEFQQHFMSSFYTYRSRKRKKVSQIKQLFVLLGSARVKAVCKHIDKW